MEPYSDILISMSVLDTTIKRYLQASDAKKSDATQSETKQPSRERIPPTQEKAKTRSTPTPATHNMSKNARTISPPTEANLTNVGSETPGSEKVLETKNEATQSEN